MMVARLEVFVLMSFAILCVTLYAGHERASAHSTDNGFKWFSNAAIYENVLNSTYSPNGWAVSSAASDWDSNTLLFTSTASATFYEIEMVEETYGDTGWLGAAYVYSNNYTCLSPSVSPPGGCNKTTEPATTAIIQLNLYYDEPADVALRPQVSKHELGHPFGLDHPSDKGFGCESIIMDSGDCQPHASSVQPHDAFMVDLLY
jgi:hypothetical protein